MQLKHDRPEAQYGLNAPQETQILNDFYVFEVMSAFQTAKAFSRPPVFVLTHSVAECVAKAHEEVAFCHTVTRIFLSASLSPSDLHVVHLVHVNVCHSSRNVRMWLLPHQVADAGTTAGTVKVLDQADKKVTAAVENTRAAFPIIVFSKYFISVIGEPNNLLELVID